MSKVSVKFPPPRALPLRQPRLFGYFVSPSEDAPQVVTAELTAKVLRLIDSSVKVMPMLCPHAVDMFTPKNAKIHPNRCLAFKAPGEGRPLLLFLPYIPVCINTAATDIEWWMGQFLCDPGIDPNDDSMSTPSIQGSWIVFAIAM